MGLTGEMSVYVRVLLPHFESFDLVGYLTPETIISLVDHDNNSVCGKWKSGGCSVRICHKSSYMYHHDNVLFGTLL